MVEGIDVHSLAAGRSRHTHFRSTRSGSEPGSAALVRSAVAHATGANGLRSGSKDLRRAVDAGHAATFTPE